MRNTWLVLLALIASCAPPPEPPHEVPTPKIIKIVAPSLPPAVWPDACVANWYAKTELPPCVESWITDITRQQKKIEQKHKQRRRLKITCHK